MAGHRPGTLRWLLVWLAERGLQVVLASTDDFIVVGMLEKHAFRARPVSQKGKPAGHFSTRRLTGSQARLADSSLRPTDSKSAALSADL